MDVFFLWLVFTSNLISQTTWLKVKLKLENSLFCKLLAAHQKFEMMALFSIE